jgi:uncharacterized membrane protein
MYKANIIATITLLILDFLWIALYMGKQYQIQITDIQGFKMKPRPFQALVAYILMVIGLNLFVLPNIRKGHELEDSLKYGLIFGIVLYGVYDFTTGAVLKKWNMGLALVDIAWGGFVYFIAAYIGSKFSD